MSEVAVMKNRTMQMSMSEAPIAREVIDTWKQMYCKGATDAEMIVYIRTCERTGLSPESRHIFIVPRWNSNEGRNTYTPQVSIDGFRLIAQRTGVYGGQLGPLWCGEDGVWTDIWLKSTHPMGVKVGVIRKDWAEPLWTVATWGQYVQTAKGGNANSMWTKMGPLMLAKCAEALALRKAFPAEMGGLYTTDEMGQAENHAPIPAQVSNIRPPALAQAKPVVDRTETLEKMVTNFSQLYNKQTGESGDGIRYVLEDLRGEKRIHEFDETDFKALRELYSDLLSGKKTWDTIIPKNENEIIEVPEIESFAAGQEDKELQDL